MKEKWFYLLPVFLFLIFSAINCSDDENPVDPGGQKELGQLSITPDAVFINSPTAITARITVPPNLILSDSIIRLIRVDQNGSAIQELTTLLDNGDLSNGDEIVGDNIFSGIVNITEANAGTGFLRASGNTASSVISSNIVSYNIFTELTAAEVGQLVEVQEDAEDQLLGFLQGSSDNISTAITQTVNWLSSQPNIETASSDGSTSIRLKLKNGLYGGMIVSVGDDNGEIDTKGGVVSDSVRKSSNYIPLKKQTIGLEINKSKPLSKAEINYADLDPKLIGNRNVLIYAPFEAAFKTDMRPTVEAILGASDIEFNVLSFIDQQADVSVLESITQYGLVIFDTHGSGGQELGTGEIVDTLSDIYKNKHKALLKAGKLAIWDNVIISKAGGVVKSENVYAVRASFFSGLPGKFPNSVIYNGSCESTMTPELENAFKQIGAKTYYGFNKVVNTGFCSNRCDSVVKRLAVDLKTTGEAFLSGTDPVAPNAVYELKLENDIRYPDDLINGDFEFGKLDGWTKNGDGRVISKLVSQNPTGGSYMGIISTGLGFTTATGKIFQTFTVKQTESKISIKWNFLSEEFLEFIGSQYQDYFNVIIKSKNATDDYLIYKTIDNLASEYGAYYVSSEDFSPGNLIGVSPAIVFDRGGVFMTGWQTAEFDISNHRGQRVTLSIEAGDVGDSIFDTAILIDDVSIQ